MRLIHSNLFRERHVGGRAPRRYHCWIVIVCLFGTQTAYAEQLKLTFFGSGANPPIFSGGTNLPDSTLIQVVVRGDYPACSPQCGTIAGATVMQGKFAVKLDVDTPSGVLKDGGYTIDVVTSDSTGRIENEFLDPTDELRMFRFTTRMIVEQESSTIDESASRFLPFRLDQKYKDDELRHGHGAN